MTKPIEAPDMPNAPLWDDRAPNDLSRPDASFHDDHVGGRLKAEESARQRAVTDRFLQQQPKRIVDEGIKVVETGAFRPTHDDELHKRAQREANRQARQGRGPKSTLRQKPMSQQEMDAARIEARVEVLMGDMQALHEAIVATQEDLLGQPGQGSEQEPLEETEDAGLVSQAEKLMKLEREVKYQLQHLISGGVGLTFLADPKLTFRSLFLRIGKWPAYVRPGYRPETDADINAFLAWVFEPAEGYAAIELF